MSSRVWVKVISAELHEGRGNSIFKHWIQLGNEWELTLENGKKVMYPVRYKPQKGYVKRGWMHRRSSEDALPPPKKILSR